MVSGDHDWASVLNGVSEGSVLGPLFFLVFINDLPELVSHYCKLFADDTKLIGVVKNSLDQKILQEDIDKLVNWSKKCNMEFNEGKCKVMNIMVTRPSPLRYVWRTRQENEWSCRKQGERKA